MKKSAISYSEIEVTLDVSGMNGKKSLVSIKKKRLITFLFCCKEFVSKFLII